LDWSGGASIVTVAVIAIRHEWFFRLRFAQSRVVQIELVPILAAFVSKSAISKPPRFAINLSSRATLGVAVETNPRPTSDAECDWEAFQKPSLDAIRESRIVSSPLGVSISRVTEGKTKVHEFIGAA